MKLKSRAGWIAIAMLIAPAWAQLDLSALSTATVKTGQPANALINTRINSLALDLKVHRGIVSTVATFEYTPGKGEVREYRCPAKDSLGATGSCGYVVSKEIDLDSLETRTGFSGTDNTVITDMYLWVGATKVKAALQERALASAQYEDIVKRRRDPALLESWGSGNYNLRIFPGRSGETRRLEIGFVQGLENDGDPVRAVLPVIHRLSKLVTGEYQDYESLPNRKIGLVSLTAASLDGRTYKLDWGGLGSGDVGPAPLKLEAKDVEELKPGILSGPAGSLSCSGCLTPWVGAKDGAGYFGVKTLLRAGSLELEPQPSDRFVILDVDGKDTASADRARKLALLSLKAYGAAPYAANLGMSDGKGGIAYLFPAPVAMDEGNLRKAYEALSAWKPIAASDAHAALRAFAKGRSGSAPCAAILINNDITPYFPWPVGSEKSQTTSERVQAEAQAWERAQAAKEKETEAALKAAGAMLFGFWNDYRLSPIANATGGFQIGGLYGYLYFPGTIAAADRPEPLSGLYLPPLFGPGRPVGGWISDLTATVSGLPTDKLVVLPEPYFWPMYDVMVADAAVRSDALMPCCRQTVDSIAVRVAGSYSGSGEAILKITGLWGGLRFTREARVILPASGDRPEAAALWAYQQSEAWSRNAIQSDPKAVANLGKDYHIVNAQMSLLALEPGMDLWTDMPSRPGQSGAPAATSVMADEAKRAPGASIDNLTLEQILSGTLSLAASRAATSPGRIALRRSGEGIRLEVSLPGAKAGRATVRILDLRGREVARLAAARTASGYAALWNAPAKSGAYLAIAEADGLKMARPIVTGR